MSTSWHDSTCTPGANNQIANLVIEGAAPVVVVENKKDNASAGEAASLKFNTLTQPSRKQLHTCYHSKSDRFTQFAQGFGFNENQIFYLTIIIESEFAEQCVLCGGNNNNIDASAIKARKAKEEYKKIEKKNIDKIDAYFTEQIDFIQQYHTLIKHEYTDQSQQHFNSGNTTNLRIKLDPIKEAFVDLLNRSYEIMDADEPNAPLISLLNGESDSLLVQILDNENRMLNDKYEILINNKTSNIYMNDDSKQQYIELNDILPLTKYCISARRYDSEKQRWSKYCKAVDILTDFKLFWSKNLHGVNARLTNSYRDVYCKSKKGSCSIFGDIRYILKASIFKEITFSFTMYELAQFSYFGFIEYVNDFKHNVAAYFDNGLIVKHSNSYCLGCCNGSATIQRWINGSKKGIKKGFQNKDLKVRNGEKIKNGDVFIFHINFDQMVCDVYVNQKKKENIISAGSKGTNIHTFCNIPQNIITTYSHENNPYIVANSKVSIDVNKYILR